VTGCGRRALRAEQVGAHGSEAKTIDCASVQQGHLTMPREVRLKSVRHRGDTPEPDRAHEAFSALVRLEVR
jgi:hypothetical protein